MPTAFRVYEWPNPNRPKHTVGAEDVGLGYTIDAEQLSDGGPGIRPVGICVVVHLP